jgi:hypothetical protein
MPDSPIYERLMDAWIEEDPKAAKIDSQIRMRIMEQQFRQEMAALQQPIQAQQTAAVWNQAYTNVAARTPDLVQLADTMVEIARSPTFQVALQHANSVGDKERIIEEMALVARGRAIPSVDTAVQQARQQADEAAAAQRQQAFVASSSAANREPTTSKSDAQRQAILAFANNEILSIGSR